MNPIHRSPLKNILHALATPAIVLFLSCIAYGSAIDAPHDDVTIFADVISSETPSSGAVAADGTIPSLGTYIKNAFPDLINGTERIFSSDNLPVALTGVSLACTALLVDHRVDEYFQERNPMQHMEKYGDRIGNGKPEVGIALALFGVGELADDRKLADTGVTLAEAYVIDGIATEGLKYAVGRKRPNGADHMSFPSGHASITATMAASISEMYDWDPRIAVPLYATTAFVAASRLQAHEHYLSDVIAGMTLGTVVGTGFARYRKEKNANSGMQPVAFVPVFDKDLRGYMVTMKF